MFGDLTFQFNFNDNDEKFFDAKQDLPGAFARLPKAMSNAMNQHRPDISLSIVPDAKEPITPGPLPIVVVEFKKCCYHPLGYPLVGCCWTLWGGASLRSIFALVVGSTWLVVVVWGRRRVWLIGASRHDVKPMTLHTFEGTYLWQLKPTTVENSEGRCSCGESWDQCWGCPCLLPFIDVTNTFTGEVQLLKPL